MPFSNRFRVVAAGRVGVGYNEGFDSDKAQEAIITWEEVARSGKLRAKLIDTATGETVAEGNKFSDFGTIIPTVKERLQVA